MSNKIYNSPGVYTTEKELYYTSESLGVTTLGAVGETLKGPAFQPIFIKNYDEFRTMFGGTSPEKFKNTQIVKYELPYIAKSYLTQSNQLFVTRVLGLSGYNAGNATLIKTIGAPIINTLSTGVTVTTGTTVPISGLTDLIPEITIDGITTGATGTMFYWGLLNDERKNTLKNKEGVDIFVNKYPTDLMDGDSKINQEFANNEFIINVDGEIEIKSYFILPQSDTTVKVYEFTDLFEENEEYKNNIVAVIRSRAKYVDEKLKFFDNPTINFTDNVLKNPKGNFDITTTGDTYYEVSLDDTKKNFIKNVLGETNSDKNGEFYCEQVYNSLLNKGVSEYKICGLRYDDESTNNFYDYKSEFQTPVTPFFVTELRGGMVERLFRLISISDGSAANTEIKVSIFNIDPDKNLFDLGVRVFNDSDKAPVFLERFTNLSMNEASANYIGRKIGTIDNKYPLRSSYIIVEVDEKAPIDAVPAGFEGYPFMNDAKQNIPYKTSYVTPKDKVKKVYLGFSDTEFGYDKDLLKFKGNSVLTGLTPTLGFHLENSADLIDDENGNKIFTTPTNPNAALINLDNTNNPYKDIRARKFTTLFSGGFDGWDIYRNTRTNSDGYKIYGDEYKKGKINHNFAEPYIVPDFDEEISNTDYYAYLIGIKTFENPEKFVVNVLVTPGIDIINNAELVRETIEIVEEKRKDSIYIPTIPDINVNMSDSSDVDNWIFPNDIVRELEDKEIDSNYTAVYYPWIQVSDVENNAYVYIPPTGEVCKNLAFTDNVAYPWFATAGYNRGIVNCVRTRIPLDLEKRDTLYLGRINPIATFTDIGNVIWGNKNLQIRDSALNRLNIRRLLLQAKKLIVSVSNRLLFDPNDTTIRSQFLTQVNPILDNIRKERGLIDFRVKLSESTDDTDRNTMRGQIFIKPTHSLEMIELEFTVTPTNVSFDDI